MLTKEEKIAKLRYLLGILEKKRRSIFDEKLSIEPEEKVEKKEDNGFLEIDFDKIGSEMVSFGLEEKGEEVVEVEHVVAKELVEEPVSSQHSEAQSQVEITPQPSSEEIELEIEEVVSKGEAIVEEVKELELTEEMMVREEEELEYKMEEEIEAQRKEEREIEVEELIVKPSIEGPKEIKIRFIEYHHEKPEKKTIVELIKSSLKLTI